MNYYFDESPFTDYGDFNPIPLVTTTNGGHTVKQLQASQSIRFASTSTSVGINVYYSTAAGRTYVLLQDGVAVGSQAVPATGAGAYQTITLATGLSGQREYEIVCVLPVQGASGNWYDSHLVLDTDSLAVVSHPSRNVHSFYGDSITGVTNAPVDVVDTRDADMWQFVHATGRDMQISGVAGGKVVNTGRDNTGNIPTGCTHLHIRYGVNDLPDLPTGNATFQTAYADMVDNARTRIGAGKPIYCYQPWPTAGSSQQANAGSLIQAAISGKANVSYVPTAGWYTTGTDMLPDGTHPNAACYALIAAQEILWFTPHLHAGNPASYAMAGVF